MAQAGRKTHCVAKNDLEYMIFLPSTAPQPTKVLGLQASVILLLQSSEYLGGEFHQFQLTSLFEDALG